MVAERKTVSGIVKRKRGRVSYHPVGYLAGQVTQVMGITYRQLDYLARKGYCSPSIADGYGQGAVRVYGYLDLVVIMTAVALEEYGFALYQLGPALSALQSALLKADAPLETFTLVIGGSARKAPQAAGARPLGTVYSFTTKKIIHQGKDVTISVPLSGIIARLNKGLAT